MTTIRIREFFDYTEDDIYHFIRIHKRSFYQIIIPKEYSFTENGDKFLDDYYRAIYAAQKLFRVSFDLLASYPEPFDKGEFSFIVVCGWHRSLAGVIYEIAKGYNWEKDEEQCAAFEENALQAMDMLREGEEWACPCYIEFMKQYFEDRAF